MKTINALHLTFTGILIIVSVTLILEIRKLPERLYHPTGASQEGAVKTVTVTTTPIQQTGNLCYLELTQLSESLKISENFGKKSDWSDEFYDGYYTPFSSDKGKFLVWTKMSIPKTDIAFRGWYMTMNLGVFQYDDGYYELLFPVIEKTTHIFSTR